MYLKYTNWLQLVWFYSQGRRWVYEAIELDGLGIELKNQNLTNQAKQGNWAVISMVRMLNIYLQEKYSMYSSKITALLK